MANPEIEVPRLEREEWERLWRDHWSTQGASTYELAPADGSESEFLSQVRTPDGERKRLDRIVEEFEEGFRRLYRLGPAVTVFGSARFGEGTPQYDLGREIGRELAKAGFAVMTGGGPGMMEAANRGAKEAGRDQRRLQYRAAVRAGSRIRTSMRWSTSTTSSLAK